MGLYRRPYQKADGLSGSNLELSGRMFEGLFTQMQFFGAGLFADKNWVVVSNILYVHPYLGKIPILTIIFQ